MKRLLLIFSYIFLSLFAYAQTGELYNTTDKLSSNLITQVYTDRLGFIWIATWNGLNSYDGYQFTTFKHDPNDENSLADNVVRCVMQAHDGTFYIGMSRALQTFRNDHFHSLKVTDVHNRVIAANITCIYQRKNGDLLFATSGHGVLRIKNEDEAQADPTLSALTNYPRRIVEDYNGQLWITTEDDGVFAIKGQQKRHFFAGSRSCIDVITDEAGNIYVARMNGGVYMMKNGSDDFQLLPNTDVVRAQSLCITKGGKLLIGTNAQGLYIYDRATMTLTKDPYYSNQVDLSRGKIESIVEDRFGNIWLGLMQKGVFKQPSGTSPFAYMGGKLGNNNTIGTECVMSIFESRDGTRWIGTDNDGLRGVGHEATLLHRYTPQASSPTAVPSTILSITEDENGRLWVGSYLKGCGWIDAGGNYHWLDCAKGKAENVFGVIADQRGGIWIGTMGDGLKRYDLQTGEVKEYHANEEALLDPYHNALVNDYIAQLYLSDDHRRLYVGTSLGLSCLDIDKDSWVSVFGKNRIIDDKAISDMTEDADGNVWVGSTDGLYCFNKKTREITVYTKAQRMADDHVAAIEIDKNGHLWVSTSHGLTCLNPKDGSTENYFSGDGLQDNEFSEGVSMIDHNGIISFGGMGGITWFDPNKMSKQKRHFHVHLTQFSVNGHSVSAGMQSGSYTITDSTAIDANHFELAHQDNSFSIMLSTLTFDNPEHVSYLYSINKEGWIQMPHGTNELSFSHLPAGTYRFRVKAIINNEESEIREFTVVIHPEWYRSTMAYIIYLLLLGALIWWYFRNRKQKEQTRLRMQEHIHAGQLNDSRLRAFMNISHELRTPMTLIFAPLETLMNGEKDPHRLKIYNTIKRNADRMMNQLNQMMDLRKIDKGQMHLKMRETDLIQFTNDILTLFEHQATSKQITLRFEHEDETLPIWIDRSNFDKVLINLIANAFKFTPKGGHITLRAKREDGKAVISVADDGIGIPEEKLPRVFDRFYQVSLGSDHHTGTGIGLDLTRSLVELHHGTIGVNNNKDKGCTFTMTLPLGRDHLNEEEIATEEEQPTQTEIYHQPIEQGTPDEELTNEEDQEEEQEKEQADENGKAGAEDETEQKPKTDFNTGKKKRSLVVVDDDQEIREFLVHELSKDYHVTTYTNGQEALTGILQHVPDLIITDYIMPKMNGAALCSKLKAHVNTNHVPIILLTAKDSDEDHLSLLELGANTIINKPFNLEILKVTIENLLHTREVLRNKFSGNESAENKITKVTAESPDERLLNRIIAVINKNLSNPDFNVNSIADEVGVSRVHLFRKMKELTNLSPSVFISNIRLKQAAQLLSEQHHSIEEITYICGFGSPSSFSRKFKSFYGMSPRDYMKEHLGDK